jgi:hypothetical protein
MSSRLKQSKPQDTLNPKSEPSMTQSAEVQVARVQKPAPQFTAQAVVAGGSFKEVSLSALKGRLMLI